MDGDGVREGAVEPGKLVRQSAELRREVAQIVEIFERRVGIVIALDAIHQLLVNQRVTMRIDDGGEGVRERLQPGAFDQRNGAGTQGSGVAVVVVVVVEAVGHEVGLVVGEHVPREDGVAHPGGEDFGGRDDQPVTHVLQLPGHFDGAGQADVQDQVVQVEGNGRGEVRHFDPAGGDGLAGSGVLVADGARANALGAVTVTAWQPSASVRGDEHAVVLRREETLHVLQHAADGLGRGTDGHVGIDLQGVGGALAVRAAVEAHQHGRVGRGVVAGTGGVVAECEDGFLAVQARKDVALEVGEVLQKVDREVVVAHAVVDEHLVVGALVRGFDAVARRQHDGGQQQEICG